MEEASDRTSLDVTAPVVMVVQSVEWEQALDWKAYVQAYRGHTAQHRAQTVRTLDERGVAFR